MRFYASFGHLVYNYDSGVCKNTAKIVRLRSIEPFEDENFSKIYDNIKSIYYIVV